MRRTSLFIEPLEKEAAAATKLGADPSKWGEDITKHLLSTHPFLNDYNIEMDLKQAIPENGTLFATIMIAPKMTPMMMQGQGGTDAIGIPVFAENWRLRPLDVMAFQGKFQPLSEKRVRSIFPQMDLGEIARSPSSGPGSISTYDLAMSPMQTMVGYGSGDGGTMKYASYNSSLLDAIADTIDPDDAEAFVREASTREVVTCLRKNAALKEVFGKIDNFAMTDALPGMEQAAKEALEPTAMQVCKVGPGYVIKSASAAVYDPIVKHITASEFSDMPQEVRRGVIKSGYYTLEGAVDDELESLDVDGLQTLGTQQVPFAKVAAFQPGTGKVEGIMMPAYTNLGTKTPAIRPLWVGPEGYTVQEKVAGVIDGVLDADEVLGSLPAVRPSQLGVFVFKPADNMLAATEPVVIKMAYHTGNLSRYVAETERGKPVSITKSAAVRTCIAYTGEKDGVAGVSIPADAVWLPLVTRSEVSLEKTAEAVDLAVKSSGKFVKVASNGRTFTLTGEVLDPIPASDKVRIDRAQAAFVLAVVGGENVEESLSKAASSLHHVDVRVRYDVGSKEEFEKYASDLGKEMIEVFRLIRHPGHGLLKYAAAGVQDTTTLDSILSLGFLNPQNIDVFLQHTPQLEDALQNVSELLVASRLGFGVDESALKNCMETMDKVLEDLTYISNESSSQFTPAAAGAATSLLPGSGGEGVGMPQAAGPAAGNPQNQGQPAPQQQAAPGPGAQGGAQGAPGR